MNTSKQIHNKIKASLKTIVDDDLKTILTDISNNQEPYDEKSIYEENIIIKIQHEKSLARLNANLENLVLALKNTNNSKNNTNTGNDS